MPEESSRSMEGVTEHVFVPVQHWGERQDPSGLQYYFTFTWVDGWGNSSLILAPFILCGIHHFLQKLKNKKRGEKLRLRHPECPAICWALPLAILPNFTWHPTKHPCPWPSTLHGGRRAVSFLWFLKRLQCLGTCWRFSPIDETQFVGEDGPVCFGNCWLFAGLFREILRPEVPFAKARFGGPACLSHWGHGDLACRCPIPKFKNVGLQKCYAKPPSSVFFHIFSVVRCQTLKTFRAGSRFS